MMEQDLAQYKAMWAEFYRKYDDAIEEKLNQEVVDLLLAYMHAHRDLAQTLEGITRQARGTMNLAQGAPEEWVTACMAAVDMKEYNDEGLSDFAHKPAMIIAVAYS